MKDKIKKGTIVYYSQCMENIGTFEVLEIRVRTIEDTWFVGVENRSKHAYLFSYKNIGKIVFFTREDALAVVKEREKSCKKIYSEETYYEED